MSSTVIKFTIIWLSLQLALLLVAIYIVTDALGGTRQAWCMIEHRVTNPCEYGAVVPSLVFLAFITGVGLVERIKAYKVLTRR